MKKMLLVLSLGLFCASLALAQDSSSAGQSASPSSDMSNPAIQGCLGGSSGSYVLTQDGTGTTFKLVGNEDQLKKHVGHEVAISGQMASDTGSAASASDQGQGSSGSGTIQVSSVKMLSKQCNAAGAAPQSR